MHAAFAIYSILACVQRPRMSCTARHTAFSSLLPLLLLLLVLSEANGASIAPDVTATAAAGAAAAAAVAVTTVGPPSTTSPAALVAWPCLRGYGVLHPATATQQTVCERCEDGVTFSDVVSANASCMSCNNNVRCPALEYHVSCTRLNDAYCRGPCPGDQYYSLLYLSCDFCTDTCRKGWEIVKDCTNQTDAVCGPAPTTAPLATTAGTTVVTSNSSNTTVQSASTPPSDSEHTSQLAVTTVGPPSTTSPAALVAWPCLRGYGVLHPATATQQTVCERCEGGVTFSDVVSANASCMSCNNVYSCPAWEYHVSCTRLNDAYCRGPCPGHQYYSLLYLCEFCTDTCRKGWEIVKDCTNQTDAVCGPAPTTAPLATTAGTTVVTVNSSNTTVQSASTPPSDSEHTSQLPNNNTGADSSPAPRSHISVTTIVVPIVSLLLVPLIAVLCILRRGGKTKTGRLVATPTSTAEFPSAGLGNGELDHFHPTTYVPSPQESSEDGDTDVYMPINGDVHPQPPSNTPPTVTTACYLETQLPGTPPKGRREIQAPETPHSETRQETKERSRTAKQTAM